MAIDEYLKSDVVVLEFLVYQVVVSRLVSASSRVVRVVVCSLFRICSLLQPFSRQVCLAACSLRRV